MRHQKLLIAIAILMMGGIAKAQYGDDPCTDPGSPVWQGGTARTAQMRWLCDQEAKRNQQAQDAQRQWEHDQQARIQAQIQAQQAQNLTAANALAARKIAMQKAITHGYKLINDFSDILLDGKMLAAKNEKIQIVGFYKRIGDIEMLYGTPSDAEENTDDFIPVITDDAQRSLRQFLLETQNCKMPTGCEVAVGGHMQMCHYLNSTLASYPPMPCFHIEVEIVYRPGD